MSWTEEVEPSANVTGEKHVDSRKDTIPLSPFMWSEAPKSIIQVGEDDARQVME